MSESSSCANCDVQIPAGARSCDNCGMPVSETVPPQEEEEDSPPRKDPAGQAPPSPTPPPRSSPPPPPPVGQPLSFLPPTQKAQQNEGEQPRKRTGTIVLVVLALIGLIVVVGAAVGAVMFLSGTSLEGKTISEAAQIAGGAHKLHVLSVEQSDKPKGTIIRTTGPTSEQPDVIDLILSGGQEDVEVPDVYGLSALQAGKVLIDAGLNPSVTVIYDQSANPVAATTPSGDEDITQQKVVGTFPKVGSVVEPGKGVILHEFGKDTPDLDGKTISEAARYVGGDYKLGVLQVESSSQPKGTIIDQGHSSKVPDVLHLTLSGGEESIKVPDVSGMSAPQAGKVLIDAGLNPSVTVIYDQNANPVAATTPSGDEDVTQKIVKPSKAGSVVAPGDMVVLYEFGSGEPGEPL